MKVFLNIVLIVLVLLAVSSGTTKILLMPQDVEFFGKYGFTDPILIIYGVVQLVGGILLVFVSTRVLGALVVGITFVISAIFLGIAGNFSLLIITTLFIVLLAFVIKQSIQANSK